MEMILYNSNKWNKKPQKLHNVKAWFQPSQAISITNTPCFISTPLFLVRIEKYLGIIENAELMLTFHGIE